MFLFTWLGLEVVVSLSVDKIPDTFSWCWWMCADFASELLTLVRRCDDTVSISPLKRKMCLKSPIRKTKIINSISICRNWFSNVFIKFYDSERFVTRFNKTPTCWNKLKIERKQQTIYSKGNCILSVYGKRMYKKKVVRFWISLLCATKRCGKFVCALWPSQQQRKYHRNVLSLQ